MRALIAVALTSALVCGCAGGPPDVKPNLVGDAPQPSESMVTGSVSGAGYQLSEEELNDLVAYIKTLSKPAVAPSQEGQP